MTMERPGRLVRNWAAVKGVIVPGSATTTTSPGVCRQQCVQHPLERASGRLRAIGGIAATGWLSIDRHVGCLFHQHIFWEDDVDGSSTATGSCAERSANDVGEHLRPFHHSAPLRSSLQEALLVDGSERSLTFINNRYG